MKNLLNYLLLALVALSFVACDPDNNETPVYGDYEKGIYIVNEGKFDVGGTITHYNTDTKVFTDSIYTRVNEITPGLVMQSMVVSDNKAFVAMKGSASILVIDLETFENIATIAGEGIIYPCSVVDGGNGKIYVSNGIQNGNVAVINASSYTVEKTIAVGDGPEGMIVKGNNLYVANKGYYDGAIFSNVGDTRVSVIDMTTNEVVNTIELGAESPVDMEIDNAGNIWVLCTGVTGYDATWNSTLLSNAELVKVNTATKEVATSIVIVPEGGSVAPAKLNINVDGDKLYYGAGYGFSNIYEVSVDATTAPTTALIEGFFYGFNIDIDNGNIWTLSDDGTKGTLNVYNAQGEISEMKDITVGRYPTSVIFNK